MRKLFAFALFVLFMPLAFPAFSSPADSPSVKMKWETLEKFTINTSMQFTHTLQVGTTSQILYLPPGAAANDLAAGAVICPGNVDLATGGTGGFATSSSYASVTPFPNGDWGSGCRPPASSGYSYNQNVYWNGALYDAVNTRSASGAGFFDPNVAGDVPSYNAIPDTANEQSRYFPSPTSSAYADGNSRASFICRGTSVANVGSNSNTVTIDGGSATSTFNLGVGDYPISSSLSTNCDAAVRQLSTCALNLKYAYIESSSAFPRAASINAFTLYVRNPTVLAVQYVGISPTTPYYFDPNEQMNVSIVVFNPVASGVSVNATGVAISGGYAFAPTGGFNTPIAPGTTAELNGTITAPATITPGTVTLNIDFVANEVNCAGNLMNMTLPIALVTNSSSDSVDLVPEIRFNNTTPGVGDRVLVTYTTRNDGTLDASPESNSTYGGPGISGWYAVPVLPAGVARSHDEVFVCPRVGLFTFNETVDSDDNVPEYPDPPGERNNYGEENLYCGTGSWTYNINCTYYV